MSGAAARPRGVELLTFAREKNGGRREHPERNAETEEISSLKAKPKKKRVENPEVGQALRSVYQRTIDEDIPADLLDLLGKLN